MNVFENRSRLVEGKRIFQTIPFSDFEAKKSEMDNSSRFLIISGIAVVILGGLSLLSIPAGSSWFYITLGEVGIGALAVIATVKSHYSDSSQLQKLPLPGVDKESDYLKYLDLDQGNEYAYEMPDLMSYHLKQTSSNLDKQTSRDIDGGNVYLQDGKPFKIGDFTSHSFDQTFRVRIQSITNSTEKTNKIVNLADSIADPLIFQAKIKHLYSEHESDIWENYKFVRYFALQDQIHENVKPYANQALFADMMGVLQGRYQNEKLNIYLQQKQVDPKSPRANSSINIVEENGKEYIILRQLFQIYSLENAEFGPFYLTAELKIDLEKGSGRLTWQSPQTQEPML